VAKKKKPKKALWKKHPELQRIADHIGKFIDRLSVKDVQHIIAGGLCIYAGNEAAALLTHKKEDGSKPFETRDRILGGATGMLGYNLTMTEGLASQSAGLITLASIGLLNVPNLPEEIKEGMPNIFPVYALTGGDPLLAASPIYALFRLLGIA